MRSQSLTNCYFGNKFEGGTFDSEITIEELIKLDGTSLFNECGYDKTIFEEIVVVLASHSFYFSDCTENYRVDLPSYIKQIFDKCANQISLKILHTNIERLDFSIRTYNVLKRAGIETIGDLLQHTEEDIVKIRNIGKSGFEEIVQKLETMGLSLAKSNDNIMRECDGERSLSQEKICKCRPVNLPHSVVTLQLHF